MDLNKISIDKPGLNKHEIHCYRASNMGFSLSFSIQLTLAPEKLSTIKTPLKYSSYSSNSWAGLVPSPGLFIRQLLSFSCSRPSAVPISHFLFLSMPTSYLSIRAVYLVIYKVLMKLTHMLSEMGRSLPSLWISKSFDLCFTGLIWRHIFLVDRDKQ